ncbi:hypothetical protein M413DRAFT_18567 [Hebeloma cylindrosporum]|uniref:glutathione transferase n=1 Tax=Hebeloma cylindrosporum TaxID=76867 RepID=A0A0C3CD38_HEBCY|nr:hypothetical protein M413DRAFT_18567 [Hebeloma cylindrosporum h7]
MIVVHHLNNSRSQRILWLLEELALPYEIKKYERTPEQLAPPELLAVHPLGRSPIITDGDVTLAESGAIVEYLIAKHGNGKGVPPYSGYIDNLYYTHYAEGSLMPTIFQGYLFDVAPKKAPFFIRPVLNLAFGQLTKMLVQRQMQQNLSMIEAHLEKSKSTWFAGGPEPTAADYQMAFPLEALVAASSYPVGPKIKEYVKAVHEREAYKTALKKGGEYAYAKN